MMEGSDELEAFWFLARRQARLETLPGYLPPATVGLVMPPAFSFGDTPELADELIALVLAGTKTAAASALWEFEDEGEPLPAVGDLAIALDAAGRPRALLRTTAVRVVAFDDVDAEHARLEGEGDRSLEHWRAAHRHYLTGGGRQRDGAMPVVLERFERVYPA